MNIAVLVKPVPFKSIIDKDGNVVRNKVKNIINKDDKHALEEALRLKEKYGGRISSISMTVKGNINVIKDILSFGIDEAILLNDSVFAGSDTNATSYILSKAVENLKDIDLIICGNSTSDSSTSQVGIGVATKLEIPFVYNVVEILEINSNKIVCKTVEGNIYSTVEVELPAVITVNEKINIPRIPTIENRLLAENKEIKIWNSENISVEKDKCGLHGSATKVIKTIPLVQSKEPKFIEGTIEEKAEQVVKIIKSINQKEDIIKKFDINSNDSKKELWIYNDSKNTEITLELIAKARELAEKLNAKVTVLSFCNNPELKDKLIKYGADKIVQITIQQTNYLSKSKAIEELLKNNSPEIFLFGKTYEGKIISAYLASKLNLGLSADCINLELDDDNKLIQIRSAYGGTMLAQIKSNNSFVQMATVLPNKFSTVYNENNTGIIESISSDITDDRIKIIEKKEIKELDLNNFDILVSGGVGAIKKFEELKNLALLLKGELGATRDVVDKGVIDATHLIGQSGAITKTKLFLSFGSSGAIEHTTGINSDVLISINNNPKAQIFEISDYCVVEDVNDFLPLLIKRLGDNVYEK